ncbi:MAG: hypothetical protein M3Q23_11140 [Actinomycetota bacterium]|nr:hypothetical protein [Actinomycetota bacterium]
MAAALREALTHDPIVVGGTAEVYWTSAEYHEPDLDICVPLTESDRKTLGSLGFELEGRHWYHPKAQVAVEFPDSRIDGIERRTVETPVGSGRARLIGLDDLYFDRLKQATINERREEIEFQSALAVAAANLEAIDWTYVSARIRRVIETDRPLGEPMRRLDSRIRRRARQRLSENPSRYRGRRNHREPVLLIPSDCLRQR